MKPTFKNLMLSAAVTALVLGASSAMAATTSTTTTTTSTTTGKPVVTTKTQKDTVVSETHWSTTEKPVVPNGTRVVNFAEFDFNHDGILSRPEIGEMMFKVYDTDGNQVLDNNEFKRRAVLTVQPVEKTTVISYDFDGDGVIDQTQMTYEDFMRDTMLSRFDRNADGLSPEEFTGREFMVADINNDKGVDLSEFKASYNAAIDKQLQAKAQVNQ